MCGLQAAAHSVQLLMDSFAISLVKGDFCAERLSNASQIGSICLVAIAHSKHDSSPFISMGISLVKQISAEATQFFEVVMQLA